MNTLQDAARFKALGSPTRLAILRLLAGHCGTLSVQDVQARLCEVLPYKVEQPTVSFHLRILTQAGLIEGIHAGLEKYYRVRSEALVCCMDALTALARGKIGSTR